MGIPSTRLSSRWRQAPRVLNQRRLRHDRRADPLRGYRPGAQTQGHAQKAAQVINRYRKAADPPGSAACALFGSVTPDREPRLAADGTGEKRQVPVSACHIGNGVGRKRLKGRDRVGKHVAIHVRERDAIARLELGKGCKMAAVIVPGDDQIVKIRGAGIPAGSDLQRVIAPFADDGKRQLQRGNVQNADIASSINVFLRMAISGFST